MSTDSLNTSVSVWSNTPFLLKIFTLKFYFESLFCSKIPAWTVHFRNKSLSKFYLAIQNMFYFVISFTLKIFISEFFVKIFRLNFEIKMFSVKALLKCHRWVKNSEFLVMFKLFSINEGHAHKWLWNWHEWLCVFLCIMLLIKLVKFQKGWVCL